MFDPRQLRRVACRDAGPRAFHDLKHRDALRKDGSSTRLRMYLYPELLRRLPPERRVWMPVAEALCSPAWRRRSSASSAQRSKKRSESRREDRHASRSRSCCATSRATNRHPQRRPDQGDHGSILSSEGRRAARHRHDLPRGRKDAKAAKRTTQMPFMPASGYAFPVVTHKELAQRGHRNRGGRRAGVDDGDLLCCREPLSSVEARARPSRAPARDSSSGLTKLPSGAVALLRCSR